MQTDFSNIIKYFPQKKLVSIYSENKEVLLHSDIVVIDDWLVFQYISTFNNEKEYVVRTFTKGLKRGGTTRICKTVKYNGLHLSLHSVYLSKQRLYRLK